MITKVGFLLAGVLVGVLVVSPWEPGAAAATGPATIRITDKEISVARVDVGRSGKSPGDMEIIRQSVFDRQGHRIGRAELLCTFVDSRRARNVPWHVLPAEREARRQRLAVLPAVLRPRRHRRHRALRQRARLGHGHPHGQAARPRPRRLPARGLAPRRPAAESAICGSAGDVYAASYGSGSRPRASRPAPRLDPRARGGRIPSAGSAPPTPSSDTSTTTLASLAATRTRTVDAWAYFVTFVSASAIR